MKGCCRGAPPKGSDGPGGGTGQLKVAESAGPTPLRPVGVCCDIIGGPRAADVALLVAFHGEVCAIGCDGICCDGGTDCCSGICCCDDTCCCCSRAPGAVTAGGGYGPLGKPIPPYDVLAGGPGICACLAKGGSCESGGRCGGGNNEAGESICCCSGCRGPCGLGYRSATLSACGCCGCCGGVCICRGCCCTS